MERITRAADRVHRPAGPWTPTVHRLLAHLHDQGFVAAPEPIELGDVLETVSFLPGTAGDYPWNDDIASEAALVTTARLLRHYHEAAATFPRSDADVWSQADRCPDETICHGDFAPYNVVFDGRSAVGIIDFDTAHPGPRVWDVASAVYRFAPFTTGRVEGSTAPRLEQRLARAAEFCNAYELSAADREALVPTMIGSLVALVTTMETEAAAGNPKFVSDLAHGRAELYRADVTYLETHAASIAEAVR